jgi:hypothetical protein
MAQKPTYEKYDPISGGFRGRLAAALTLTDGSIGPVAVSLNTSGRVVVGTAGASGPVGVMVFNGVRQPVGRYQSPPGVPGDSFMQAKAGEAVDIMTAGEIVGLDPEVFTPGSKVYAAANGSLNVTGGAGTFLVGVMAGANTPSDVGRLIVRFAFGVAAQV